MIFQDLQNRALGRGSPNRARGGKPLQRALHPLKIVDPPLNNLDLLSGFPLHRIAGAAVTDPEPEQFLDLTQREAEILRVLDETEPRYGVVGVLAVAGWRAPVCGKESSPLVIADRLDVDVDRRSDLSDGEAHGFSVEAGIRIHPIPRYMVKGVAETIGK